MYIIYILFMYNIYILYIIYIYAYIYIYIYIYYTLLDARAHKGEGNVTKISSSGSIDVNFTVTIPYLEKQIQKGSEHIVSTLIIE